jgi:hypothetical protein
MALRQPDIRLGPYPEKTTRIVTATVKDETGAVIPGSSLTTMTYTLYDEDTVTAVGLGIINSRDDVNCKPSVSEAGVLTLELLPNDMVIVTSTKDEERHRLLLEWTYSGGTKRGSYEAQLIVQNVEKVA